MLCDRLVVGIRDAGISEKLQMDRELTLEKAKKLARQKEAVKDQYRQLQKGTQRGAEALLEGVRRGIHGKRSSRGEAKCMKCKHKCCILFFEEH